MRQTLASILQDYSDRRWLTRGVRTGTHAVQAWDIGRAAQRAGDWRAVGQQAGWFLRHPDSLRAIAALLLHRRQSRGFLTDTAAESLTWPRPNEASSSAASHCLPPHLHTRRAGPETVGSQPKGVLAHAFQPLGLEQPSPPHPHRHHGCPARHDDGNHGRGSPAGPRQPPQGDAAQGRSPQAEGQAPGQAQGQAQEGRTQEAVGSAKAPAPAGATPTTTDPKGSAVTGPGSRRRHRSADGRARVASRRPVRSRFVLAPVPGGRPGRRRVGGHGRDAGRTSAGGVRRHCGLQRVAVQRQLLHRTAAQPKADVHWDNCQGKPGVPTGLLGPGGQFTAVPIPDGAVPASGSDAELTRLLTQQRPALGVLARAARRRRMACLLGWPDRPRLDPAWATSPAVSG